VSLRPLLNVESLCSQMRNAFRGNSFVTMERSMPSWRDAANIFNPPEAPKRLLDKHFVQSGGSRGYRKKGSAKRPAATALRLA
jgi:hypothetical protein